MAEALLTQKEHYLENGARVIFESLDDIEIFENPSETAVHEAWHMLAALIEGVGIEEGTIIPEGMALGKTKMTEHSAFAFVAAHAMHCDGTDHDLRMVALMGGDVDAEVSAARARLSGPKRYRQMLAIATLLDKRKSVGGDEAWAIFNEMKTQDAEGKLYFARIIHPDGSEEQKQQRIRNDQAKNPKELIQLIQVTPSEKKPRNSDERADILVSSQLVRTANDN